MALLATFLSSGSMFEIVEEQEIIPGMRMIAALGLAGERKEQLKSC